MVVSQRRTGRARLRRVAVLAAKAALGFVAASALLVLALRWLPTPLPSVMSWQRLQAVRAGAKFRHVRVPLRSIAPHAVLAVISAEDQRFPDHHGFDLVQLRRALEERMDGHRLRGASTLTQQVAKNVFLWRGRSVVRKALEAYFTVLLELFWSKERIVEEYLNVAEFGDYTFGVEAASRRYFGKPASKISVREAALLAAVLPNPKRYRVDSPSDSVLERQVWIEEQMRQLGGLSYLDRM